MQVSRVIRESWLPGVFPAQPTTSPHSLRPDGLATRISLQSHLLCTLHRVISEILTLDQSRQPSQCISTLLLTDPTKVVIGCRSRLANPELLLGARSQAHQEQVMPSKEHPQKQQRLSAEKPAELSSTSEEGGVNNAVDGLTRHAAQSHSLKSTTQLTSHHRLGSRRSNQQHLCTSQISIEALVLRCFHHYGFVCVSRIRAGSDNLSMKPVDAFLGISY